MEQAFCHNALREGKQSRWCKKVFWLRALRVIKLAHFLPKIYEELALSLVGSFESRVRVDTCVVFLSLIKHLCQTVELVLTGRRAL